MARDFFTGAGDDAEKLDIVAKYALGYKNAFFMLQDLAISAHADTMGLVGALASMKDSIPKLSDDISATMRMLGGVCQLIKVYKDIFYYLNLD